MAVPCLVSADFSRGDDSNSIFSRCVDYDQNSTQGVGAKSDEAGLAFRVGIFDGNTKRISERLLGVSKADAEFAKV
jgi:hypothetical protein